MKLGKWNFRFGFIVAFLIVEKPIQFYFIERTTFAFFFSQSKQTPYPLTTLQSVSLNILQHYSFFKF